MGSKGSLALVVLQLKKINYHAKFFNQGSRDCQVLTNFRAADKWITGQGWWTAANGIVVDNLAGGTDPTCSGTRVLAFLVDAGFCLWTISADDAFGSAGRWAS